MQTEELLYYIVYYVRDKAACRYISMYFDEAIAQEHARRMNRDYGSDRFDVAREPLENAILRAINATR